MDEAELAQVEQLLRKVNKSSLTPEPPVTSEPPGGKRIVDRALAPLPCDGPDDTPRIHYEFR